MRPAWLRDLPPDVEAVILVAVMALILGAPVVVGLRLWLRRVERGSGWTPQLRLPLWFWVFLVVMVTGGVIALAEQSRGVALAGWAVVVAIVVGVNVLIRRATPTLRTLRLANQVDHNAALADVRARIDHQRAALLGPVTPLVSVGGDPWSAPEVANPSLVARRALANDLNTLGVIESLRKDHGAALAAFEEAEAVAGGHVPLFHGNQGYALGELERFDEAVPRLRSALADLPAGLFWPRAVFLAALAEITMLQGNPTEAEPLLDQAIQAARRDQTQPRAARRQWFAQIRTLQVQLAAAHLAPGVAEPPVPDSDRSLSGISVENEQTLPSHRDTTTASTSEESA